MKEKINPLNKSLIVSALSPDSMDIVVTKLDYFGNGNEIRHWVVKNKHNQTVFLFKRETLKDTYKFIIKINGLEISAEQGKSVTDSFWAKLDKMLHDKEKRQKTLNITAMARKMMSVQNGIIYDHLVSTLQR